MAFSYDHKARYTLVFGNRPAVREYIRLCDLGHPDLIGKGVQEIKDKIEIIDPFLIALRKIEHKMGAEIGSLVHCVQTLPHKNIAACSANNTQNQFSLNIFFQNLDSPSMLTISRLFSAWGIIPE